MKKLAMKLAVMFCLCAVFALGAFKADTHAAATDVTKKVKMTAYIDSANKLHMRFNATFTFQGYIYEVSGNGATLNGVLASDKNEVVVALGDIYAKNQTYKLTLTSKDTNKCITASYYTGAAVGSLSAAQEGTSSTIKTSWKVGSDNDYKNLQVHIDNPKGEKLNRYFAESVSADSTSKTISDSTVQSGNNTAYVIGIKNLNGANYYGYGQEVSFPFIAQPVKIAISALAGKNSAHISWNQSKNATGYDVYMMSQGSSAFKLVKKVNGGSKTSVEIKKLAGGKKYSFKVQPFATNGTTTLYAPVSGTKTIKLGKVPGKVTKIVYVTNPAGTHVGVGWGAVSGATGYEVWTKVKGSSEDYTMFGQTSGNSKRIVDLARLNPEKTYCIVIYAKNKTAKSQPSKVLTLNPAKYIKKHRTPMLAKKVRGIRYLKNKKCDITSQRYTTEVKEAYVNYKGLSSRTKYLIWVSLYTQQATIYTGKKGNWKMIRTFDIASGSWENRTPRGTHKLTYREKAWQHSGWRSSCVTHFYKKASFHMRPKYNDGRVKDPRMRKPISNACVRCYDEDAKFIHKLPLGTTVKVY